MGAQPFKRKWPKELQAACVAAMLDYGYSGRQAAEAANRGELPGKGRDLVAFPIPESTVGDWGKDARRLKRQTERAAESPDQTLRTGLAHLVATWERDVDALRKRKRAVKPEEIAALGKAGVELERLTRQLHKQGNGAARPAEADDTDNDVGADAGFVAGLAQREAAAKKSRGGGRSLAA